MPKIAAKSTTVIDHHVGIRIRDRRSEMDMSPSELGLALGVTLQQIRKYECGTNRVGASRLFNLGRTLTVPVSYFFEGLDQVSLRHTGDKANALYDFISSPNGLELAAAFSKISDLTVRRRAIDFIRVLSENN